MSPKQNTSIKRISIPEARFNSAFESLILALAVARNGVIDANDLVYLEESVAIQSDFLTVEAFLNDAIEHLAGNECFYAPLTALSVNPIKTNCLCNKQARANT